MPEWVSDDGAINLFCGDCIDVVAQLPKDSIDAIVCDPPYGLQFMGKEWDSYGHEIPGGIGYITGKGLDFKAGATGHAHSHGLAHHDPLVFQEWCRKWAEALLRVVKPGAHMLAFGGTRTHHRLMCAIEDAGWEIRDCVMWIYGSGFPKSRDISKAIDKAARRLLGDVSVVALKHRLIKMFDASGKTRSQIDAECGFRACNYLALQAAEKQPNPWTNVLPSQEKWQRIKEVIEAEDSISDELDALYAEAERAVIGQQTKARKTDSKIPLPTSGAIEWHTWNITAPATDTTKRWDGWGTALKPAWELAIVARKSLDGTVAANVLKHGCGGLNIDGCRIETSDKLNGGAYAQTENRQDLPGATRTKAAVEMLAVEKTTGKAFSQPSGRWPANLIHDGSGEVVGLFPNTGGQQGKVVDNQRTKNVVYGMPSDGEKEYNPRCDSGSAARFFYCAKANKKDRNAGMPEGVKNDHPTVKPTELMKYLCRLVTPPGGVVLDPFMGSGSTGKAAILEDFNFIGIEKDKHSFDIAVHRVVDAMKQREIKTEKLKNKTKKQKKTVFKFQDIFSKRE